MQRFFSITDCNAEPTGLYMSFSNKTLFFDIQHRGGDGADLSMASERAPCGASPYGSLAIPDVDVPGE